VKNDPEWWTYVVPVLGATVSVAGAVFVGWRQRRLTRTLAKFQADLADNVLRRQICLAFGSRALLVANRASELSGVVVALAAAQPHIRLGEMEKRNKRLDHACDGFAEAWSELLNCELATPGLTQCVNEFSEQLEAARLRMLTETPLEDVSSLQRVEGAARRCRELSAAVAAAQGRPAI
jgi:hypothetical protein